MAPGGEQGGGWGRRGLVLWGNLDTSVYPGMGSKETGPRSQEKVEDGTEWWW